jgi:FkbM family methyltransferase
MVSRDVAVAEINGYRFEIDSSLSLDRELMARMEPETDLKFALQLAQGVGSQDVFLDVGANAGYWTIPMAKQFKSVFAFEPVPEIYAKLNRNIALNRLSNVSALQLALSDKDGFATFAVRSTYDNFGGVNNGMGSLVHLDSEVRQELTVPVDTIDLRFASRFDRVGMIKIDVEGAENLVLRGAQGVLKKHRPVVISEMLFRSGESFEKWKSLLNRFELFPDNYGQFGLVSGELIQLTESNISLLKDFNLFSVPLEMAPSDL